MTQKRHSQRKAAHDAHAGALGAWRVYGQADRGGASLPDNWRDRLPDPADYYRQHVAKLGRSNGSGWAQGVSPFRDEREPSFSVCQSNPRGPWRDFATGETGDLVSFHMRLTGKPLKEAVADLLAGVRR
ncbi:CHC2 zinc finger domain-containing protein [Xanthomonas albilineans]|uniref:CHC2 zinc finger domain-containing protein n=1 Tax=Xanthomonas albilineans TaxID=29447 RepID=UPI0027D99D16|nr:CHC2 zinc finger domain-containing protein [Xanthomonas albilineans]